jgi:hypothetical protein
METRPYKAPYSSILPTPKMDLTSSNLSSPSSLKLTNQFAPTTQSFKDILYKFRSIKDISYTLFKIEAH